jgi:hypothetical protein
MLMVGDQKVRLQDVQKIEDSGLKERQELHDAIQLQSGGNAAVPEAVLKNLAPQVKSPGQNAAANPFATGDKASAESGQAGYDSSKSAEDPLAGLAALMSGPQPIHHAANKKMHVKPEDKPEAKLKGAVLPLEVASANDNGAGHVGGGSGISLGGAFARK